MRVIPTPHCSGFPLSREWRHARPSTSLRTGSGGHPVFAQSGKPATDLVQAASELCAVFK